MSEANPELPPARYWRCIDKENCGRKWHHTSMGSRMPDRPERADLFTAPVSEIVVSDPAAPPCPSCGSACVREPGFVYGDHLPAPLRPENRERIHFPYVE